MDTMDACRHVPWILILIIAVSSALNTDESYHSVPEAGYFGNRLPLMRSKRNADKDLLTGPIPDAVDWRETKCVTPVKNQWPCGSCWAFSATGALETHACIKSGVPAVSLSAQNLMDCTVHHLSSGARTGGCQRGGSEDHAFRYVLKNGGLATEESYPYELKPDDFPCRSNGSGLSLVVHGHVRVPKQDESALKEAVALRGPVSVGIYATHKFNQYVQKRPDDIFFDEDCPGPINHAVLVVGYGTQNGTDYWLIKNSYGTYWGDQGYVKMARNKDNHCGIASEAVYPLM